MGGKKLPHPDRRDTVSEGDLRLLVHANLNRPDTGTSYAKKTTSTAVETNRLQSKTGSMAFLGGK